MDGFLTARFPSLPPQRAKDVIVPSGLTHFDASNENLLSRLRMGDVNTLAQLFSRYSGIVRHIGQRILRDDAEAQDLVQDLFLFLERKCSIFDGSKSSARSWIIQMAYHRAIERRRYLAARKFYDQENSSCLADRLVGKPTGEDDYSLEVVFGRNGMAKVLRALTEDQRETIRLFFFEGYTLAEVAAKLNQPLGNVRNHYYRGLNKLRKAMFPNHAKFVQPCGK